LWCEEVCGLGGRETYATGEVTAVLALHRYVLGAGEGGVEDFDVLVVALKNRSQC
jgi:hypothetical protein